MYLHIKKNILFDEPLSLLSDGEKYSIIGYYLSKLGYDIKGVRSPIWLDKEIPGLVKRNSDKYLMYTSEYCAIQFLEDSKNSFTEDEYWNRMSDAFQSIGVELDVS